MAYIQGRVQDSQDGDGIANAFLQDNFGNTGSADPDGLFHSDWAYFPGYVMTAGAYAYLQNSHEITESEWGSKWMTIRLDRAPASSSCFSADTMVVMASGASKRIAEVRVGERVLGPDGTSHRVEDIETPLLDSRKLFSFNRCTPFVTSEHPFQTSDGWKAIDPVATARENDRLPVGELRPGDQLLGLSSAVEARADGNLALVAEPEVGVAQVALDTVIGVYAAPNATVYNLLLEDGHAYFANGFLVHNKGGGW